MCKRVHMSVSMGESVLECVSVRVSVCVFTLALEVTVVVFCCICNKITTHVVA